MSVKFIFSDEAARARLVQGVFSCSIVIDKNANTYEYTDKFSGDKSLEEYRDQIGDPNASLKAEFEEGEYLIVQDRSGPCNVSSWSEWGYSNIYSVVFEMAVKNLLTFGG